MKNDDFNLKFDILKAEIKKLPSLAIAFSGGVDSTFLLAVAKKRLGDKVLAIISKTAVFPEYEELKAIEFLKKEKIRFSIVSPDLMSFADFTENTKNRCYICKKIIFKGILDEAINRGIHHIAHGLNTDDFNDYRPGIKAAGELGFLSPLAFAGFSKEDIRRCSRRIKLSTADKPAMACLASRIPYGTLITEEKLKTVEKAENILRNLGFDLFRVRYHGDIARIEVDLNHFKLILSEPIRQTIVREFKKLGFLYVSLDLEGYNQGSLNRNF